MCNLVKRTSLAAFLLLCLSLALTGCGGSSGGAGQPNFAAGVTTISGLAAGPVKGARVSVYQLTSAGTPGVLLGQGTTGSDGRYAVPIPTANAGGPLLIVVSGGPGVTYTSAAAGADLPFTAAESYSAVLESGVTSRAITVSAVSNAATKLLPSILAAMPGAPSTVRVANAVVAANARVGALYNIPDIMADPASDNLLRALILVMDRMVQNSATGGAQSSTTPVATLLGQALVDVNGPAYQTYLQAFNTAADQVQAANPGLIAAQIPLLKNSAANPPAPPNFNDTTPPTAPTGLAAVTTALDATTSSVALSWNAATDNSAIAGYQVFRNGIEIATVTGTSYTDPSVLSNVTYSYQVLAFDQAGNRSPLGTALPVKPNQSSLNVIANGQVVTTGLPAADVQAPSAPANLSAVTTALTATTSSVALSWSASTDNLAVTGYDVFRTGVKIATVTATSYLDPSVTSNVNYSYTVVAFDAAGNRSAASTPLSVTPNQASLGVIVNGQVNP